MARELQVTALGRSWEGGQFKDKMSYRVAVSDSDQPVVFEARVTLGTLEVLDKPEDRIKEYYATAPFPKNASVVDLNL
jgi:BioD-like phosphotransacetylase family protein